MWQEFRNLNRAFLAGVCCPRPIMSKENVLFMSFLGADGWPAPTMKEVAELKLHKQKKMQDFYIEIAVQVVRLYICAQLVHGDLSEYNILLVPSDQVRGQVGSDADVDIEGPDAIPVGSKRAVLIDFAQAVSIHHPQSRTLLERDCARVNSFFKSCGAEVLTDEDLLEFITSASWERVDIEEGEEEEEVLVEKGEEEEDGWTTISENGTEFDDISTTTR